MMSKKTGNSNGRRINKIILSQAPLTISSLPDTSNKICVTTNLNFPDVNLRTVTPTAFTLALFEANPLLSAEAVNRDMVGHTLKAMLREWRRVGFKGGNYQGACLVLADIRRRVSVYLATSLRNKAKSK